MKGYTLYERTVWHVQRIDRWAVTKSRYGGSWYAAEPGEPRSLLRFPSHAEAVAYVTAQARKES